MTQDFEHNETTGSFSLNGKHVCRGYYGTETLEITDEVITLTIPRTLTDETMTLTIANNGTTVRIFSISRDDYNSLLVRYPPWKQTPDRVWFMATFKNLDGHVRNWGTKKNTFGKMFEEIVSPKGIVEIMEQTSSDLCISYFIRHNDNDLYGEVDRNQVLQTIAWNSTTNRFVNTYTLPLAHGIEYPMRLSPIDQTPNETLKTIDLKIENGYPILLTIFNNVDGSLVSTKYITEHDECIRHFRCRTHNRFAALFATEQLLKQADKQTKPLYEKELAYARANMFTQDELEGFEITVKAAFDELYNDLSRKLNGAFVVFPNKLYVKCEIKKIIDSYQGNNSEENHKQLQQRITKNLCMCTDTYSICAIEQFLKEYGRMNIE